MPDLHLERRQPPIIRVERRQGLGLGDTAKLALGIIGPAMRGADGDIPDVTLNLGNDAAAPVATEIVEGTDNAVPPAHDQRALAKGIEADEVTGFGQVIDVRNDLPMAPEEMLDLEFEQFLAEIGPGRQSSPIPIVRDL